MKKKCCQKIEASLTVRASFTTQPVGRLHGIALRSLCARGRLGASFSLHPDPRTESNPPVSAGGV